jgi:hypothetical protein
MRQIVNGLAYLLTIPVLALACWFVVWLFLLGLGIIDFREG